MIIYTGDGLQVFVGVLFVVVLIIPCALLKELFGPHPALAVLHVSCIFSGLLLAGWWCRWYGNRINKEANLHTVYDIPFQNFAFGYWGLALFLAAYATWDWMNGTLPQ